MARTVEHHIDRATTPHTLTSYLQHTDATRLKVSTPVDAEDAVAFKAAKQWNVRALRTERARLVELSRATSEGDLLKAVMDWFEAHRVCHWRVALGPAVVGRGGRKAFITNPMTGMPDVQGVVPNSGGRMFVVETKHLRHGRVAPHQREWHEKLAAQGVLVIVARCLDDVTAHFNWRAR